MGFLRQPRTTAARRVLFQVHSWTGVAVGLYGLVIGLSGAALAFRPQMHAGAYPAYFSPLEPGADLARPETVIEGLKTSFPGYRFSGIEYPTERRGTFLAYLAQGDELRTVFSDPYSGRPIGELQRDGWIYTLQELHFNLLAGQTGIVVNGIGAASLLVLCLTGLMIWWPGIARWRSAVRVDVRKGWKRLTWELHGAAGVWMVALLVMWAVSGIYFSFPVPFRNAVARAATLTDARPPSSASARPGATPVLPSVLVAQAARLLPDARMARVFVPATPSAAYAIVMATETHGDYDSSDEVTLYFDQYTGELLQRADQSGRTAGDRFLTWLGLLHVGSFGGWPVRLAWLVTGLTFPLLFITGFVMWWNRIVVRTMPARIRESA
jgi:uncharacterized iron-regulated membrane protein